MTLPGFQDGGERAWWWRVALHLDEAQTALANATAYGTGDPSHAHALHHELRAAQVILLEIFRSKGLAPNAPVPAAELPSGSAPAAGEVVTSTVAAVELPLVPSESGTVAGGGGAGSFGEENLWVEEGGGEVVAAAAGDVPVSAEVSSGGGHVSGDMEEAPAADSAAVRSSGVSASDQEVPAPSSVPKDPRGAPGPVETGRDPSVPPSEGTDGDLVTESDVDGALFPPAGNEGEGAATTTGDAARAASLARILEGRTGRLRAVDAYVICGIEPVRATQDQVARIVRELRSVGWERQRQRVDGTRQHVFVKGTATERTVDVELSSLRSAADEERRC